MKEKLQKLLDIIKENKAYTEIPSKPDKSGVIILGGYSYCDEIFDVLGSINHDLSYMENYKKLEGLDISNYTMQNIETHLTYLSRAERFCEGVIAGSIDNGILQKLVERYLDLLSDK